MKATVQMFSLVASFLSLIFLLSWHLGFFSILQLPPSTSPIPYVSALCLFLSGFALFTLFSSYRVPISKILGIPIFLLAFQRMAEGFFPANLKWHSLINSMHFYPSNSTQMVISASLGFMLVGAVFMLWPQKGKTMIIKILLLFISVIIVFLGSAGIFTAIIPTKIEGPLQRIFLHFYTAVGLFLIGLAFIFARFHGNFIHSNPLPKEIKK